MTAPSSSAPSSSSKASSPTSGSPTPSSQPAPERPHDAALTWAGAFALSLPDLDKPALQAAWESPEAEAFRATMKASVTDAYRQLVDHVRARLAQLSKETAA